MFDRFTTVGNDREIQSDGDKLSERIEGRQQCLSEKRNPLAS